MLLTPRFFCAAFTSCLNYFNFTFFEPVTAPYLLEAYSLTEMQIGLFFSLYPIFQMVSCILVQFIPKKIEKRLVLMTASLLYGLSLFLAGPSQLLRFEGDLTKMIVGQAFLGILAATMLVPALGEMISAIEQKFSHSSNHMNNQASGVYNCVLAIGQVLAPPYATYSTDKVGFRLAIDYQAILILAFSVFYFVVA